MAAANELGRAETALVDDELLLAELVGDELPALPLLALLLLVVADAVALFDEVSGAGNAGRDVALASCAKFAF